MTKRILTLLAAALFASLLASCAVEQELSAKRGAPAATEDIAAEAVMVEPAPAAAPAVHETPLEECSGDGIGGTGCPNF